MQAVVPSYAWDHVWAILGPLPGRLYGILELAVGSALVTLAGDTNRHRYWLLCHLRVLDRGVIEFRL